ncbi:MAG: DUF2214 family protein [Cyclobacteriaceae bacterium]|nr:DUF2214 family protein [Cyclobacteriaceae bacterium]
MTALIIARYAHFAAVFMIVAAILAQQFLVCKTMTRHEVKRVAKIDAMYGLGALLVLFAGFTLWFFVGKPAGFYSNNWIFHTKLTLYILLGLLSIYPTLFFLKNRKGNDMETKIIIPSGIIILLRIELGIVIIIPLLATLMSLGIGHFKF